MSVSFSILMACYKNTTIYELKAAVESVLCQMLPNDEFVLVADGPLMDDVSYYLEQHRVLKVFYLKENVGLARALNHGLKKCCGEYILRMDSDDISHPDRLNLMRNCLTNSSIDVLGGYIQEFNSDNNLKTVRKVPETHSEILAKLKIYSPMNHVTVAIRRTLLTEMGGYPNFPFIEDYALWQKLLKVEGVEFRNIPKILVYVKSGQDQFMRRRGVQYFMSECRLAQLMLSDRQINKLELLIFITIRMFSRLGPSVVLKLARKIIRS